MAAGTTIRRPMPIVARLNTAAPAPNIKMVNWKFIDSVA
jgi:hypothetical protein